MTTLPEQELLYIESLRDSCDYVYDGDAMKHEPKPGVVFVHLDNIQRFFRECRRHSYVVVSANSDFSLFYQADHHPNTDLRRLSAYLKWNLGAEIRDRYIQMPVGPACDPRACDPRDLFSVKTYCWTKATFPAIPENIQHWFVTNTNIVDNPKVEWLPYGLFPKHGVPKAEDKGKRALLYVNFALHTDERVSLMSHYAMHPWVTTITKPDLSLNNYWQDIADHEFVLCPAGNGLDCVRNYETLYLGSIPVMKRTLFSENFARHGLPVLLVDSLFDLTPGFLERAREQMEHKTYSMEALRVSYWRERIEQARKSLL